MVTTTLAWEYLVNGSMIQAAYESYNVPFSAGGVAGYPIGILFIVFMVLLYIQNRDVAFNFVVSLFLFAAIFSIELSMDQTLIPVIIKGFIVLILILELTGIIYVWATKES